MKSDLCNCEKNERQELKRQCLADSESLGVKTLRQTVRQFNKHFV